MSLGRLRLVTFDYEGKRRIGAHVGQHVVDFSSLGFHDMKAFLGAGSPALSKATEFTTSGRDRIPFSAVKIRAPM
jgi:hypothetical protein